MKNYKVFLLLLAVPLAQQSAEASLHLPAFAIAQRIEVLKFEVSLLRSLLKNMREQAVISSPAYIALRLSDNAVLLEKNPGQTYPVASITKLMTAVIALENIEKDQKITLTKDMLKPLGWSPSLYLGLSVSAENLLKAALIQSSNDAAETLAYFVGKQKFIQLMNQKAKGLEMTSTVFKDAHGLSAENLSTASDLAKLLTYINKNHAEILKITRENDFWLPDKSGTLFKFQNVNNFYPLSNFFGGKTGYLSEAKQTFAGIFEIGGEPTVIVALYSNNRQADAFNILNQLGN